MHPYLVQLDLATPAIDQWNVLSRDVRTFWRSYFELRPLDQKLLQTLRHYSHGYRYRLTDDDISRVVFCIVVEILRYNRAHQMCRAFIGNSGGLDSATTCALLSKAILLSKEMGIQFDVVSYGMPISSNPDHNARAEQTATTFGIEHLTIHDLDHVLNAFNRSLSPVANRLAFNEEELRRALGNVKARIRMITNFFGTTQSGSYVVSTDNLSELYMAFWTLMGDVGAFGPIQSILKGLELPALAFALGVPTHTMDAKPTDGLNIHKSLDQDEGGDVDAFHGVRYPDLDAIISLACEAGLDLCVPSPIHVDANYIPSPTATQETVDNLIAQMVSPASVWKRTKGTIGTAPTREQLGLPQLKEIAKQLKGVVSVVGLGKLGSCMVAVYASKGRNVMGVDLNDEIVTSINTSQAPVQETGLPELIRKNTGQIKATPNVRETIHESDITFIIVPTPSLPDGSFSLEHVQKVCRDIGEALKTKNDYHLVVLTSTLLPGDCDTHIIPTLERHSGKSCGKDFGFCYSPLFIAIGSVIQNLLNPDFFLVGEFDKQSGDTLESFYRTVCDNNAPARRMSIPSAELTKISVNSYVTMKITFANMLGEVAERIPGVDIDDVTQTLGSDKRIGGAYLKSGLGFGGPCFPRDNRAFAHMARRRGVETPFAERTDEYNKRVIERWAEKIMTSASKDTDTIALIGMSYKPDTAFAEESQTIGIARLLIAQGYNVHAHNPYGNDHARVLLGDSVTFHDELAPCLEQASVVFLGLPMTHLLEPLVHLCKTRTIKVIDPWRQWKEEL